MRELGLAADDEKNIVSVLENLTASSWSRVLPVRKSTSLTAFIRRFTNPSRIMTVEDPVEYEVAGINQTQVNSEIGFTFASALREIRGRIRRDHGG